MMSDDVREYAGDCEQPLEYYVRTFKCVRDEIERLRADYQSASEQRDQVQQQYREKCAEVDRLQQHITEIEQLHREHLEEVEAAGRGVWVSEEQIDKAWRFGKYFLGPARNNLLKQLSLVGIVECPECGGRGGDLEPNRWGEREGPEECPGCAKYTDHGWIREEHGDE